MEKATEKQLRFLKMLMADNYKVLGQQSMVLVSNVMGSLNVENISQLDRKAVSSLISLLKAANDLTKLETAGE